MKRHPVSRIEWTGLDLDDLVWKFASNRIAWGTELVIKENQVAAIFTPDKLLSRRLKMLDYFGDAGNYVISIDTVPLVRKVYPDIEGKHFLEASIIFCTKKVNHLSHRVYSSEAMGQASAGCEADACCRFRISDPKLFLETLVANHKKTNDEGLLDYLFETLGNELFRRNRPYGWESRQTISIEDLWRSVGIEILSLQFDHYKKHFAAVGV